jgi:ADP-heptose:LPS heptosyltransferase
LGNAILLIPLLKTIRESYPNKKLYLVTSSPVSKILFDMYPFIDEVFLFKIIPGNELFSGILYYIRHIRPIKPDLYISHFLHNLVDFSIWGFFSGATFRISYNTLLNGCLDTFALPVNRHKHEVERNLEIAKFLEANKNNIDLFIPLQNDAINFAQQFLESNGMEKYDTILGIHPGCDINNKYKRWPIENFTLVAKEILRNFNVRVIFFIGPGEEELIPDIQPIVTDKCVIATNLLLSQSIALVSQCNVFLSNDSGLMHVAAAFKIPTVALFGKTSAIKNKPWMAKHIIIQNVDNKKIKGIDFIDDIDSIKRISPQEVIKNLSGFILDVKQNNPKIPTK